MSKSELLSSESIAALQNLLCKSIYTIWAPNLDAAGAHLAAWTLSMNLSKDSFMNFSCEWSETPYYLNDSWQITVQEGIAPLNIKRQADGAYLDVCTISLYQAKPIRQIEILTYEDIDKDRPEETVHYDQAIKFVCEEGKMFCIGCLLNGPGIATYLHFSEDPSVIQEMTDGSTARLCLK